MNRSRLIFGLIILNIFFFSCKKRGDQNDFFPNLVSPLRLNLDSTFLYLSDYTSKPVSEIEIVVPKGLRLEKTNDSNKVLLIGALENPIDIIQLKTKKSKISFPVFKSNKQKYQFEYKSSRSFDSLFIIGSFNGWVRHSHPLKYDESKSVWNIDLVLNEGFHAYKIWTGSEELLDENNPSKSENGLGGYNNILKIGYPDEEIPFITTDSVNKNEFDIVFDYGNLPDQVFIFHDNNLISEKFIKKDSTRIRVSTKEYKFVNERSFIRVFSSRKGKILNDILLPLHKGNIIYKSDLLSREDHHNLRMYFVMVDRFFDGEKNNNRKNGDSVLPKADFMGGDLIGIQKKIKDSYLDSLYLNALWISPIARNPDGAWGLWQKGIVSKFASYHGYWPISYSQIDPRFGKSEDLNNLISELHQKNTSIFLDYVANHVHIEHPLIQQFPDWKTELVLPDGSLNLERWDEHRLTTWFDVFLPSLDLENPVVREAVTDSALFWFKHFDLDGFRHDATKHIPEDYWRLLSYKFKTKLNKDKARNIYQIGETYGGPELISSYVSSGMLNGQFDFNLYDAALRFFAADFDSNQSIKQIQDLKNTINEGFRYYGYHHLMGNISGNQDKPRFVSLADGSVSFSEDTKLAGWTREIGDAKAKAFPRLANMMALNFFLPGIPVIYYGDEIGMPGANDPDNRRMMKFSDLNEKELWLKNNISQLSKIRKENLELIYGDTKILTTDGSSLVIMRSYMGQISLLVVSKNAEQIQIKLPKILLNKIAEPLVKSSFEINEGVLTLSLGTDDFAIIKFK